MSRPTEAIIDLSALRHNLRRVREIAPKQRVLAVVKADAYGHGAVQVADALGDEADAFAVACLEEAIELRDTGIQQPIVLLEGFFSKDELPLLSYYRLDCVIHNAQQIKQLINADLPAPLTIWLKMNSGMHRLGFKPEEFRAAWETLSNNPQARKPLHLMTHLAYADERNNPASNKQCALFAEYTAGLTGQRSIANSAGILAWQQSHADWVRPGIMLYGASPFPDSNGVQEGLRPVMQLQTRLVQINQCKRGDAPGYGGIWRCPEDMPVGVATIGYADGYPRHTPPGTPVLLNSKPVPLIGRVSMDMITLDLREQPQARTGDPVILWGNGLPAETVAHHAGTITYELFSGVGKRVKRHYIS